MAPEIDQDAIPDPIEKGWWFIVNWVIPGLVFFALLLLGFHYYCSAIAGSHSF